MIVFSNNIIYAMNKSIKLIKILMQKAFKLFLSDKNVSNVFYFMIVLLLAKQSHVFKNYSCK